MDGRLYARHPCDHSRAARCNHRLATAAGSGRRSGESAAATFPDLDLHQRDRPHRLARLRLPVRARSGADADFR